MKLDDATRTFFLPGNFSRHFCPKKFTFLVRDQVGIRQQCMEEKKRTSFKRESQIAPLTFPTKL